MALIKNYLDTTVSIDENAYLAENCTLIGSVILEKEVNIWYGAVLRADANTIKIEEGVNIQDNCVVHCNPGFPTLVKKHASVGHGAILHGCTIGENTLVGMNATVLDGAIVGNNCIIGANALVSGGTIIPDNSLVVGVPAKVIRNCKDTEIAHNMKNYEVYIDASKKQLEKYGEH